MKKNIWILGLFLLTQFCSILADTQTDRASAESEIAAKNKAFLQDLIAGNDRFAKEETIHPNISKERVAKLSNKQNPFVTIVSCSDSRVPPEIIFDQGLGDIFVVRTAGNVVGDFDLGSIEYAVKHLGCSLIIVLGHEDCGAVSACLNSDGEDHHNHIDSIIKYINSQPGIELLNKENNKELSAFIKANVVDTVDFLKNSKPVLKKFEGEHKIEIIGALYNPATGKVSFLED